MAEHVCTRCDGTGKIIRHCGWESESVMCPECNGTKIKPRYQCNDCKGTGTVWDDGPKFCWACKGKGIRRSY